jgi:uncharacterized SAM-binding protein YcdF (DUF218 family)
VNRLTILVRLVGAATVLLFLAAAFTPAVGVVELWLNPARAAEHAEAIVVLGSGGVTRAGLLTDSSLRAAMKGVSLYRDGWAPLVVFSGADGLRRTEAEARADFARQSGVPLASVKTVSASRTTREEAVRIQALLQPLGIRKILLVVDGPGTARAAAVFARVGFDVVSAPWSKTPSLEDGPEERLQSLRPLAMEVVARLYYRAMGYL